MTKAEAEALRQEVAELRGQVAALAAMVQALLAAGTHTTTVLESPAPAWPWAIYPQPYIGDVPWPNPSIYWTTS